MALAIDTPAVIFVVVVGVVAVAVIRGLWGTFRGDRELDTSASMGRQIFGRWKKS